MVLARPSFPCLRRRKGLQGPYLVHPCQGHPYPGPDPCWDRDCCQAHPFQDLGPSPCRLNPSVLPLDLLDPCLLVPCLVLQVPFHLVHPYQVLVPFPCHLDPFQDLLVPYQVHLYQDLDPFPCKVLQVPYLVLLDPFLLVPCPVLQVPCHLVRPCQVLVPFPCHPVPFQDLLALGPFLEDLLDPSFRGLVHLAYGVHLDYSFHQDLAFWS